jgi:hypothetical protein
MYIRQGQLRNAQKMSENMKGREHLQNQGAGRRVTLKRILNNLGKDENGDELADYRNIMEELLVSLVLMMLGRQKCIQLSH